MSFDLANVLSQAAGRDTGIDPNREKIEYISVQDIEGDPHNFYSTDGIDELAANIEMVGLQQPIRVKKIRISHSLPEGGYEAFHDVYRVVSGHRRLAAWKKLDQNCPEETYRKIAAIVEPERKEPEALQELRLIFANSDTRKMTGPDLQQQARRIRELLQKLKDDGYEFKGRMRDHVAQICGVSKSKLSRLDAIESNLHQGIKNAYYNTGRINETVAYEISKMPMKLQSEVCRKLSKGCEPTADDIRRWWSKVMNADIARKELVKQGVLTAEDDLKKIRDTIREDYEHITADPEEDLPEEDESEWDVKNVPLKGTLLTAEWQRGDPPHEGRYLCLVDLNTTRLHEQKCDYRDGQWMAFGGPILDMFKVLAWWPLPKDPGFMTSRDLRDLNIEEEEESEEEA